MSTDTQNFQTLLTAQEIATALSQQPGWYQTALATEKQYKFNDFHATMIFVNQLAQIAHAQDHHPELQVSYNQCRVRLTTHSAGGLSAKDFDFAKEVEQLLQPQA
jgi:4a-hydroxytetrahydrobiopterin dehydratase